MRELRAEVEQIDLNSESLAADRSTPVEVPSLSEVSSPRSSRRPELPTRELVRALKRISAKLLAGDFDAVPEKVHAAEVEFEKFQAEQGSLPAELQGWIQSIFDETNWEPIAQLHVGKIVAVTKQLDEYEISLLTEES